MDIDKIIQIYRVDMMNSGHSVLNKNCFWLFLFIFTSVVRMQEGSFTSRLDNTTRKVRVCSLFQFLSPLASSDTEGSLLPRGAGEQRDDM